MGHHLFRNKTGWCAYTTNGDLIAIGTPDSSRHEIERELTSITPSGSRWVRSDCGKSAMCLTLNVSHHCNLRCRYCYAGGGSYGTGEGHMSQDVARRAIRDFLSRHNSLLFEVKFFGGEPLLNLAAMRAALEELEHAGLRLPPKIGVVTNGTLITEEFLDLRERYDITVTVSIDGPQGIHDLLRCNSDGLGSYDEVMRGVERCLAAAPEHRLRYEATYTRVHQEAGVSRLNIAEFMLGLGLPIGFTYRYIGTDETLRPTEDHQDLEFTATMLDNLLLDRPYTDYEAVRAISQLVSRRYSDCFCPVGITNYLVSPNGDVYPCNLFVEPRFCMGSIHDPSWRDGSRAVQVRQALEPITTKGKATECADCWVYHLCGGCPAVPYRETGFLIGPAAVDCKLKQRTTETTLGWLAEVFREPSKWERLQRTLRRFCLVEN